MSVVWVKNAFEYNLVLSPTLVLTVIMLLKHKRGDRLEILPAIFVFMTGVTIIIGELLHYLYTYNQWYYNLVDMFNMIIFFLYFKELFQEKRSVLRGVFFAYAVSALLFIIVPAVTGNFKITNIYASICSHLANGAFAFLYLRNFVENNDNPPWNHFAFWFCTATIFDSLTTIPIIGLYSNLAWTHPELVDKLMILYDITDIIWITLLFFGFIWTRKVRI